MSAENLQMWLSKISIMCSSEIDDFAQKLFITDLEKSDRNVLIDALATRASELNFNNSLVVCDNECTID